ncbi:unnamed protein product, partial [Darwinula stevensoni]
DTSRRSSWDWEEGGGEGPRGDAASINVLRENGAQFKSRRLVPKAPLRAGMLRLSLLLDFSSPGASPDPGIVAAVLDLPGAPVVTRAAFLLECAYFVHRCNRGQWPFWMKLNQSIYKAGAPAVPSQSQIGTRGQPSIIRRVHAIQRAAGRLFYSWAEILGVRLEEIMDDGKREGFPQEEARRRQLRREDEEEDFLDESTSFRGCWDRSAVEGEVLGSVGC